jgi:hypothetical protein
MKLFEFKLEVRDGLNAYTSEHLVLAETERTADKKARAYAETYLGSKMKWGPRNDAMDDTLLPADGSEYREVRFWGVYETTETMFANSLLIAGGIMELQ